MRTAVLWGFLGAALAAAPPDEVPADPSAPALSVLPCPGAGGPPAVRPHAHPSDSGHYFGYYVGGGAPCGRGDYPHPDEGTWGWDYGGLLCFPNRVFLHWWHGCRQQGGTGGYKTDGPRLPYLQE
jgi:hypothetical protein